MPPKKKKVSTDALKAREFFRDVDDAEKQLRARMEQSLKVYNMDELEEFARRRGVKVYKPKPDEG